MVTSPGEIDAKHFLIAIIAIVAIVAIAFTVVFATGGFEGAAFAFTKAGSANTIFNGEKVSLDIDCFYFCAVADKGEEFCVQECSG